MDCNSLQSSLRVRAWVKKRDSVSLLSKSLPWNAVKVQPRSNCTSTPNVQVLVQLPCFVSSPIGLRRNQQHVGHYWMPSQQKTYFYNLSLILPWSTAYTFISAACARSFIIKVIRSVGWQCERASCHVSPAQWLVTSIAQQSDCSLYQSPSWRVFCLYWQRLTSFFFSSSMISFWNWVQQETQMTYFKELNMETK